MSRSKRRGTAFEKPDVPIGPVLESYGADVSRARGSGWTPIRCPFHDDSNASASVNLETNHFCCWVGCTDRTEDTIGLVQHIDNLDFLSAKRKAEEAAGVSGGAVRKKSRRRTSVLDEPWT